MVMVRGMGGDCMDIPGEVCTFIYEDYIFLIENISLVLLLLVFISYSVHIVLYKKKNKLKSIPKNETKTINHKRKHFIFIVLSLFLLFTTFLYTFLNLIIPKDLMRECRMEMKTECSSGPNMIEKPLIYLYPEEKLEIKVELDVEGKIIADYPKYDTTIGGWEVTAYPDGKIIENGNEYSYLFWEAEFDNNNWDLSKGFIVEGKDSRKFLEEKLSYIGLTPKEYNEFIVYWYPKMMNNKYNLVYFAGLDYDSRAPLNITPKPDTILRVFTVIKPLDKVIEIEEQELKKFERKGFSVIEWGGTILDGNN